MKICPNCSSTLEDNAAFCPNCNAQFEFNQQPNYNYQQNYNSQPNVQMPPQPNYAPAYDPYDHTAEFDAADISANKVFAMLVYLMGTVGVIIALLASHSSQYTLFHVRQGMKFTVVNILMLICAALLFWTIIVPIAYGVMSLVFSVIRIICFFQICSGKAKEPVIIRSLKFLR